ncbi:universal stress protein [Saccharopolyspora sp. ASAGF58]|uniref:universal stress protein n=1 Tax=Saccharopolyspora sp. ASAGF58 TaxID=2719023 RepID=UPI00143FFD04|nr:universal stress protein [Saccharopolyspora sp. ASAGF58]QIZ38683.1 hypothetical protein FDZ84_34445 [Saccharopolyspora sp. ASAGF58]
MGSVAVALCARGHCSVAVVRRPSTEASDAAVVVGVDDSPGVETVLNTAFEEAAMRGAPLEAVHAWHTVGTEQAWYSFHVEGRAAAIQDEEERVLADTLASWSEKYPHSTKRNTGAG